MQGTQNLRREAYSQGTPQMALLRSPKNIAIANEKIFDFLID